MKNYRTAWSLSLLLIACISVLFVVCSSGGISLPDSVTRILGVLDMCAVVVLAFTSVKLRVWEKQDRDRD